MSQDTLIALPSESQPIYTYQALQATNGSCRILELKPRTGAGTICGTLQEAIIDGAAEYVALSYEWGPAHDYDLIEIDDCPFRVRRNLFSCLTEYSRRIRQPAFLFVDAICIDQSSTQERSAQVAIMGKIFQQAREVFIWLGADGSGCATLFHMADPTVQFSVNTAYPESYGKSHLPAGRYSKAIGAIAIPDLDIAARWFDDSSASYWSRAWVVQEILLARQTSLNCGHACVSWEHLSAAIQRLINSSPGYKEAIAGQQGFRAMDELVKQRKRISPERKTDPVLVDYMFLMKGKQCADIRDRFYSILGLLKHQQWFSVSYTNSMPQVFLEALIYSCKIGAIHGRQAVLMSRLEMDLLGHLRDAFDLQLHITFSNDLPEECRPPNFLAELKFTVEDPDFLKNFANKSRYFARSEYDCTVQTISREVYENWKFSAKRPISKHFHVGMIVLVDQSRDGIALFIWLGPIVKEVAEAIVKLDINAAAFEEGW